MVWSASRRRPGVPTAVAPSGCWPHCAELWASSCPSGETRTATLTPTPRRDPSPDAWWMPPTCLTPRWALTRVTGSPRHRRPLRRGGDNGGRPHRHPYRSELRPRPGPDRPKDPQRLHRHPGRPAGPGAVVEEVPIELPDSLDSWGLEYLTVVDEMRSGGLETRPLIEDTADRAGRQGVPVGLLVAPFPAVLSAGIRQVRPRTPPCWAGLRPPRGVCEPKRVDGAKVARHRVDRGEVSVSR